ncbi:MAG: hypothetical protein AAGA08_00030 [Pseudomonadota bacterium]
MDRLMPIFRATPVAIFAYGVVSALLELLNTHATIEMTLLGANDIPGQRIIAARAYVFSVDNFFFYTGLAALVAIALQYERSE